MPAISFLKMGRSGVGEDGKPVLFSVDVTRESMLNAMNFDV